MNSGLVMYEEEFNSDRRRSCDRLARDANAKVVFIVDKNGQLIAVERRQSRTSTRPRSPRSPPATSPRRAASRSSSRRTSSPTQFHEGEKANIHIQLVGNRVILVVIFDAQSSTSGSCACA